MKKETVLILLLLKPMSKTSQFNNIAIMIFHGGCPVLKISIPCFLPLFWWKSHERNENEKKIVLFLKPMTKSLYLMVISINIWTADIKDVLQKYWLTL